MYLRGAVVVPGYIQNSHIMHVWLTSPDTGLSLAWALLINLMVVIARTYVVLVMNIYTEWYILYSSILLDTLETMLQQAEPKTQSQPRTLNWTDMMRGEGHEGRIRPGYDQRNGERISLLKEEGVMVNGQGLKGRWCTLKRLTVRQRTRWSYLEHIPNDRRAGSSSCCMWDVDREGWRSWAGPIQICRLVPTTSVHLVGLSENLKQHLPAGTSHDDIWAATSIWRRSSRH